MVRGLAIALLFIAATGGVVGGALAIHHLLSPKAPSCSQMAEDASAPAGRDYPEVDLVIGVAGNTQAVALEAEQFVKTSVVQPSPAAKVAVDISLVDGDRTYNPTAISGSCLNHRLLVAPAAADIASYQHASTSARPDVAKALEGEFERQVTHLANVASDAVLAAPRPTNLAAGAFDVWPFVTQQPLKATVDVLDVFTTGGNNCLTVQSPSNLDGDGQTLISQRVQACIESHLLPRASEATVRLQAVKALDLTGPQEEAQSSVISAMCQYAASNGCGP
jgi:hypothetical protein